MNTFSLSFYCLLISPIMILPARAIWHSENICFPFLKSQVKSPVLLGTVAYSLISALKAEADNSKFQASLIYTELYQNNKRDLSQKSKENKSPVLSNNKIIIIKPNTITRHLNTHQLTKERATFVEEIMKFRIVKSLASGHRAEEVAKLVFKPKLNYNTHFPHCIYRTNLPLREEKAMN